MTMPSARKITIGDRTFDYLLKGKKGRIRGNTGPCIRLTVEVGKNKYLQAHFWSKSHDPDLHDDWGLEHKVPFTPKDVRATIVTYLENDDTLPEDFEVEEWTLGWSNC